MVPPYRSGRHGRTRGSTQFHRKLGRGGNSRGNRICGGSARRAGAGTQPKGKIPPTPFTVGHMTFQSGPGAALGAPALKGHTLAADEINAEGGFLGARKIVTIAADEAAGVDGNVKELRRMKLAEGIDWFTGVISAGDT